MDQRKEAFNMNKVQVVVLELEAKTKTIAELVLDLKTQLTQVLPKSTMRLVPTVVILPENFLFYSADPHRVREFASGPLLNQTLDSLAAVAKEQRVWLIAGSLPVLEADGFMYIETICFNDQGIEVARYRKNHLFKAVVGVTTYDEGAIYAPGHDLVVLDIAGFKFGLAVCFDLRFPIMFAFLRKLGAEVLVVPAAFTAISGELAWESLIRARAIETQCYAVGCGLVGQGENGAQTWGHSLIVGPSGKVLVRCEAKKMITATLQKTELELVRKNMPMPIDD